MKKKIVAVMLGVMISMTGCSSNVSQKDYDEALKQVENIKLENEKLNDEVSTLEKKIDTLTDENKQLADEYDGYKKKMKPFEEMEAAEAEQRKVEAEAAKNEQKNQETANNAVRKVWNFEAGTLAEGASQALCDSAKEEISKVSDESVKAGLNEAVSAAEATLIAQQEAAAAEAAQGYETGITYDQLARTPDDFKSKKVKFYGKVIQVIEDSSSTTVQIRLAVNDNYDTVLLGEYASDITASRVLEDDYITIYGTSVGTISYKSTMGGTITIPGVYIDKIDQ